MSITFPVVGMASSRPCLASRPIKAGYPPGETPGRAKIWDVRWVFAVVRFAQRCPTRIVFKSHFHGGMKLSSRQTRPTSQINLKAAPTLC